MRGSHFNDAYSIVCVFCVCLFFKSCDSSPYQEIEATDLGCVLRWLKEYLKDNGHKLRFTRRKIIRKRRKVTTKRQKLIPKRHQNDIAASFVLVTMLIWSAFCFRIFPDRRPTSGPEPRSDAGDAALQLLRHYCLLPSL